MIVLYDDDYEFDFSMYMYVTVNVYAAVDAVERVDNRYQSQVARLMYPRCDALLLRLMSQSSVG